MSSALFSVRMSRKVCKTFHFHHHAEDHVPSSLDMSIFDHDFKLRLPGSAMAFPVPQIAADHFELTE